MFKRYELHNHTLESDAQQSCSELIEAMEQDGVDVFAFTDHNTVSGHRIIRQLLEDKPYNVRAIYGMEYTTYYGHILCQNLNTYVPWDSINRHKPELLFEACKKAGALVGIAHPFALGDPFARGCRFEMKITDFSCVDYIEIINNQESMQEVNSHGIAWWEKLVLDGNHIAACAGMDMHRNNGFAMKFATYIKGTDGGEPAQELITAIKSGETWVSNGIALVCEKAENGCWHFSLNDLKKPGFIPSGHYIMALKTSYDEKTFEISDEGLTLSENDLPCGNIVIPKLYAYDNSLKNILCISPVIYR
ncbi:MAG: CehA/McbA family metallohydrolase [Clostridia bacterium]|nr:CehA/McbA family metallohydrolase [Clostridia bacterium]